MSQKGIGSDQLNFVHRPARLSPKEPLADVTFKPSFRIRQRGNLYYIWQVTLMLAIAVIGFSMPAVAFQSPTSSTNILLASNSYQGRPFVHRQVDVHDKWSFVPSEMPKQSSLRFTALEMSSIRRRTNSNENKVKKLGSWLSAKLPPPPEDQLSMIGDIGCLFLYSFLDHFVNKLYDKWMNSPLVIDFLSASAAIESSSAANLEYSSNLMDGGLSMSSLPVWFDTYSSAPFGTIPLRSALPIEHHITYAPAIEAAGMASVLMSCAWLCSGYFTGAFQYKNTMECSTNHALVVTAKTWIFSSLIMLGIAWFSDSAVGCVNCLHKSVGITKADADYIFDSLSVLLIWRYILSSFFGYDNHQGPPDRRS